MIKDIREKHKNVLLLDCGDVFSERGKLSQRRAETAMEGLGLMKYDALNVADGDLLFGLDFLKTLSEGAKVPLLSANIVHEDQSQYLGQQVLFKEFSGLTVGILGLASPDYFDRQSLAKEGIAILDPEKILQRILAEIRAKVDVVVLLSHVGFDQTKELVQKVSGVDVAVSGHGMLSTGEPELVGKTLVVQNSFEGRYLGILMLTWEGKGLIPKYENAIAPLSQTIPEDTEVAAIVARFQTEERALVRAEREEQKKRLLMEQHKEMLEMNPEEFIAQMKEKNRLMTPEEFKEQVRKRSTPPAQGP